MKIIVVNKKDWDVINAVIMCFKKDTYKYYNRSKDYSETQVLIEIKDDMLIKLINILKIEYMEMP